MGTLVFTGNLTEIVQILPLPDRKILARGLVQVSNETFEEFHQVLRLMADGSVDHSFRPYTTRGTLGPIALQSDGKAVLVEHRTFDELRLVRLNSDGTIDGSFVPQLPASLGLFVNLAIQPDGKLILTGSGSIIRLLENGSADSSFESARFTTQNGNAASTIFPAVAPNGSVFVHGFFSAASGAPRPGIARLNTNGSLDTDFNPAGEFLVAVHFDGDGTVLVYNSELNLVRLMENGTIDGSFRPIQGDDFRVAASGKIYSVSAESARNDGQQPRIWLASHRADGTLDTNAAPVSIDVDFWTGSITPRAGDEFLVYGSFTRMNGHPRPALASISADGASPKVLITDAVWETNGEVVSVVRTGNNAQLLTVNYQTEDLSARNGVHYEAASGQLSFAANQSSLTFPLRLIDNPHVQRDVLLNALFSAANGTPLSESPLAIMNDDPGFVLSELHLPWTRTVALRFSGRGSPILERSQGLRDWLEYEEQPDKREILVPQTQSKEMEFYTFRLELGRTRRLIATALQRPWFAPGKVPESLTFNP